jgi:hypothetical protein
LKVPLGSSEHEEPDTKLERGPVVGPVDGADQIARLLGDTQGGFVVLRRQHNGASRLPEGNGRSQSQGDEQETHGRR